MNVSSQTGEKTDTTESTIDFDDPGQRLGAFYEPAIAGLFVRDLGLDTYKFCKLQPNIMVGDAKKKKEVDLFFVNLDELDLKRLKDLWIGKNLRMFGSVSHKSPGSNKFPLITGDDNKTYVIPKLSIVFQEIKIETEMYLEILNQHEKNLSYFKLWVSQNFSPKFFKKNRHNIQLADIIRTQKKDIRLYFICIVNGDSSKIPTGSVEINQSELRDALLNNIKIGEYTFIVDIVFLYIPNYVADSFLCKKEQETLENFKNEIIKFIQSQPSASHQKIIDYIIELAAKKTEKTQSDQIIQQSFLNPQPMFYYPSYTPMVIPAYNQQQSIMFGAPIVLPSQYQQSQPHMMTNFQTFQPSFSYPNFQNFQNFQPPLPTPNIQNFQPSLSFPNFQNFQNFQPPLPAPNLQNQQTSPTDPSLVQDDKSKQI